MPHPLRLLLLALALGLVPGPAAAQAEGITLTPARVERNLDGRDVSLTYTLTNDTDSRQQLSISVADLGHETDGTPRYDEDGPASDGLTVRPTALTLAPRERQEVTVRGEIPGGDAGLYVALLAEFDDDGATPAPANQVQTRSRIAGLVLLRGPKPWDKSLDVTDVTLRPSAVPEQVEVVALARNTGDVHVNPTGTVTLTGEDGTRLDRVTLTGQTILPGFARALVGTWSPPAGFDGQVALDARLRGPDAAGSGSARFADGVLVDPGTGAALPAPGLPPQPEFSTPGEGVALPLLATALALLLVVALLLFLALRRRRDQNASA
ncbi:MAG: hypothetical protein M3O86_04730 [Actinomycetota bacterium]|nr:hypothetical protein [Actinomycetota bacterium]